MEVIAFILDHSVQSISFWLKVPRFPSVQWMEMAKSHETNGELRQQVNCNNNKRSHYNTHRAIKNNAS